MLRNESPSPDTLPELESINSSSTSLSSNGTITPKPVMFGHRRTKTSLDLTEYMKEINASAAEVDDYSTQEEIDCNSESGAQTPNPKRYGIRQSGSSDDLSITDDIDPKSDDSRTPSPDAPPLTGRNSRNSRSIRNKDLLRTVSISPKPIVTLYQAEVIPNAAAIENLFSSLLFTQNENEPEIKAVTDAVIARLIKQVNIKFRKTNDMTQYSNPENLPEYLESFVNMLNCQEPNSLQTSTSGLIKLIAKHKPEDIQKCLEQLLSQQRKKNIANHLAHASDDDDEPSCLWAFLAYLTTPSNTTARAEPKSTKCTIM